MIDPVIADIASAIQVRHIQTSITYARQFSGEEEQAEVRAYMREHLFDATPLFRNGVINGWVRLSDLNADAGGSVQVARHDLTAAVLIDARAPLEQLLERFRLNHRFIFVVGAPGITGIVTPSDMNKQAGRTHLFLDVSALELALAHMLRRSETDDKVWLSRLKPSRVAAVRGRQRKRQERDDDTDLVAAFDFADLLTICRAELERDATWRELTDEAIAGLAAYRNSLMHAVVNVTSDDEPSTDELISKTGLVARLLGPLLGAADSRLP